MEYPRSTRNLVMRPTLALLFAAVAHAGPPGPPPLPPPRPPKPVAPYVSATGKAGRATVCVTPEKFLWMAGYAARKNPAEGKVQDLFAKALALEDETGGRFVFVTMDL